MASKKTTHVYPNGSMTVSEAPFDNDRAAYYDFQMQEEWARRNVSIQSRETVNTTVVLVETTGVVRIVNYKFDAENYWEA